MPPWMTPTRKPQDWPGVHCAKALLRNRFEMVGKWVDRTELYEARRRAKLEKRKNRGRRPSEADYTSLQSVTLSKLPCWEHKSDEDYFREVRNLVTAILEEYEEVRATVTADTRRRLTRQDPEHRPASTKKGPKPICHAASQKERIQYREQRQEWVAQYRSASKRFAKDASKR